MNVKVSTVSRPKPRWRRTPAAAHSINKKKVDDDDDDALPIPIVTYVHGKGCIYSDSPDVVIKPAHFVKAIDDLAKTRHDKLVKILDDRVSQTEPVPGVEGGRAHSESTSSSSPDTVSSSSASSASSTNSETNANSPTISTTSWEDGSESGNDYYEKRKARKAKEEANILDLIVRLTAEETSNRVRNEQARLRACMATSSLAKGLYFKRCNGIFRNALDDELLPLPAPASALTSHVCTSTLDVRKEIEPVVIKSDTSESTKSTTTSVTSSTVVPSTSASVSDIVTPFPTTASASPSVSVSDVDVDVDAGAGTAACTLSGAGYALLAHEDNIPTSPTSPTSLSTHGDHKDENESKDMNTFFAAIEHARAHPQLFKFTTPVLMSREALVRDGKVEAQNLEKTSWSLNNLQRRVRIPPSPKK